MLRLRFFTTLCAAALLSGCVGGVPEQKTVVLQEPPPDFRTLIAKNLATKQVAPRPDAVSSDSAFFISRIAIFAQSRKVEQVAVSDISRQTQTMLFGPAWQTCMRATIDGTPFTIAVFAVQNKIIDARTAVQVDECGAGTYVPINVVRPRPD